MYNVTKWVEEIALAKMGLTKQQIDDAARMNESALEPLLQEFSVLPVDESMKRTIALRELGRNMRSMGGAEFMEVMTTAHFSTYFGDALSRAFYKDYDYSVGSWMDYTYPDEVPDFRNVDRGRMSEPGTLQKRREKAPHSTTYISETWIEYSVEEYSEQFDVSWRTILNDDLGEIKRVPQRMAKAAKRWLDEWVSALYDNATTQAGMIALGAVFGGTGRLTAANLAIGLNAMMQRTDVNGNQMNINRIWLVIPKILQIQAADILKDLLSYGGAGGNVLNEFVAGVRVDPYIGFAGANAPWYLVADPSEVPTITVARLAGWPGPAVWKKKSDIEMMSGTVPPALLMGSSNTGDIEYVVQDVIGAWDDATYVGITDYRGLYYSSGTTV